MVCTVPQELYSFSAYILIFLIGCSHHSSPKRSIATDSNIEDFFTKEALLKKHFNRYLPSIKNIGTKKILLLDYSAEGLSFHSSVTYIRKNYQMNIKDISALAIQPDTDFYDYEKYNLENFYKIVLKEMET